MADEIAKIGDTLTFRKVRWTITDVKRSPFGVTYYKYRVHRRYFGVWLSNTDCTYEVDKNTWHYYEEQLKANPRFHYTQR